MLSHLDDHACLAARARRTAVLACALTAAVLAPIVDLALFSGMTHGLDPELRDVVSYSLWAPVQAGALGALVAHLALRARPGMRVLATICVAAVGGVLQLSLVLLATLPAELARRGLGGLDELGMAGVLGAFGSVVSAPMGAAFGILFLLSVSPAARSIEAPSQDGPAWVDLAVAAQLAAATGLALAILAEVEGAYCQALFVVALPSLGLALPEGSDVAWTRYLLAAPLAMGALVSLARGLWELATIARCVRALRSDQHPRWRLSRVEASLGSVVPLLGRERAKRLLEVVARESAPYRGGEAVVTALAEDA